MIERAATAIVRAEPVLIVLSAIEIAYAVAWLLALKLDVGP